MNKTKIDTSLNMQNALWTMCIYPDEYYNFATFFPWTMHKLTSRWCACVHNIRVCGALTFSNLDIANTRIIRWIHSLLLLVNQSWMMCHSDMAWCYLWYSQLGKWLVARAHSSFYSHSTLFTQIGVDFSKHLLAFTVAKLFQLQTCDSSCSHKQRYCQ